MQFIHLSTRLSCDCGRAYRFMTKPDYMKNWAKWSADIDLQPGGKYVLKEISAELDTSGSTIVECEREKILIVTWKDSKFANEMYELKVHFMKCRSDTEYCTEIHLMFRHRERNLTESEHAYFNAFFAGYLESMRYYQNKDWIIQDADLSLSWLRGSEF